MKTMFNFGDPHKDFTPIANEILGDYEIIDIPVTNNKLFYNQELQIVDAAYGPSLVLDSLTMMGKLNRLNEEDQIIFLGSMGSLSLNIKLDDLVVPSDLYCAYFGNRNKIINPDANLANELYKTFSDNKLQFLNYKHGSVMAVFDPTTDHDSYTNELYPEDVEGIDCSESYIGLKFCNDNQLVGVALLYCSDDPLSHITNISKEEFDKRALERDMHLHHIAKETLLRS